MFEFSFRVVGRCVNAAVMIHSMTKLPELIVKLRGVNIYCKKTILVDFLL